MTYISAQENAENNGGLDSMNADSKLRAEFLNKPVVLSVNTRKSRSAIDSKLAVDSEIPPIRDSLLQRGPRSAEDNEDNETIATTSLPLENDASSISPAQSVTMSEEEVDSSPITTADPEKDVGAGDNAGSSNSDEISSTTTPTPAVSDNDDDEVKVEHQASSSEDVPALEASEHQVSSSEDVPSTSPSSQNIDVHPTASPLDITESTPMISFPTSISSVEQTESEAPVPSSPAASEEHEEEVPVASSSPTSEEQVVIPASEESNTQEHQSLASEPDVNNDLETTTLINTVDSSSDDTSPEKTSSEADITENTQSEETTGENEDNFLDSGLLENEDIDAVTTEDDEDDGPTDATFEEPTGGSTDDGESTEQTVPAVPESSVATSTSSTLAPSIKYNFMVYDESNIACILASMSITLRVSYKTRDPKVYIME